MDLFMALTVGMVLFFGCAVFPTEGHELDGRCANAVRVEIRQGKEPLSYFAKENPMGKLSGFFSTIIDGCVATMVDDLKNEWLIFDIHNSLLRDFKTLFQCQRGGVDNVNLEKARAFHGYVIKERYGKWLDDGLGGPPATLKTPSKPFTREDCRHAFNMKVAELAIRSLLP